MDLFSCLSPFVFSSFASGSSGNCYYVGKQDEGLLVDVGINALQITKALTKIDIPMSRIRAILITHDHIDHVKGLEVLTKSYPIPPPQILPSPRQTPSSVRSEPKTDSRHWSRKYLTL